MEDKCFFCFAQLCDYRDLHRNEWNPIWPFWNFKHTVSGKQIVVDFILRHQMIPFFNCVLKPWPPTNLLAVFVKDFGRTASVCTHSASVSGVVSLGSDEGVFTSWFGLCSSSVLTSTIGSLDSSFLLWRRQTKLIGCESHLADFDSRMSGRLGYLGTNGNKVYPGKTDTSVTV